MCVFIDLYPTGKPPGVTVATIAAYGSARRGGAIPRQPFEIAAILLIVRMFVGPAEGTLGKLQIAGIPGGLVSGGKAVHAKADAIKVLVVGENR
jgi:hypothetical protein